MVVPDRSSNATLAMLKQVHVERRKKIPHRKAGALPQILVPHLKNNRFLIMLKQLRVRQEPA